MTKNPQTQRGKGREKKKKKNFGSWKATARGQTDVTEPRKVKVKRTQEAGHSIPQNFRQPRVGDARYP